MLKRVTVAMLAAGLLAAALPASAAQVALPTTITLAAKQKSKKPPTPAQLAFRARQKKCGAEWRAAKAAGKTNGMKWPQFWSACNKRLKGGG
ncbi:MAG TPA: hypothetical protein VE224_19315 [Pseudolabrys sp.]|jgi:lipoprotein-anchoring transpeptidase ErfK/SrfK|nr:hypothetical protein [Pseudolabrys sp.]